MKLENRDQRQREIIEIAFGILETEGYSGLSMQALAKASKASKETLYGWFGGKDGLYEAMVTHNAATLDIRQLPEDPRQGLVQIGRDLLAMLMSDRAVLLNRIAAAEAGKNNALGLLLARSGRDRIMPEISRLIGRFETFRSGSQARCAEMADLWLALLVADLQVRRVTGAIDAPDAEEIRIRSERAATFIASM